MYNVKNMKKMLLDIKFAMGFLVMVICGLILFNPRFIIPQLITSTIIYCSLNYIEYKKK